MAFALPIPLGAARWYLLVIFKFKGLTPSLKYGPTGETKTRKVYDGAGLTPKIGPVPHATGLIYKLPSHKIKNALINAIDISNDKKFINTNVIDLRVKGKIIINGWKEFYNFYRSWKTYC